MNRLVRVVYALAIVCLLAITARGADTEFPAKARDIFAKADQLELLSLDPNQAEKVQPKDAFHGYKVLGKTVVKAGTRKQLVEAFLKGMEGKIEPARCFDPRHGIRATHGGKTVELVICFQCSQFVVYLGSAEKGTLLLVGKAPEASFDKVLKDAGIPKAKKGDQQS